MNIEDIKALFPILQKKIYNKPLVYLDNAATNQKPFGVIGAVNDFYCDCNSNVHRGVYKLAADATLAYEDVREKVRVFINAQKNSEIIFTSGATESINLVAQSYGRSNLALDDEIIITAMEHHSNIVPWQMICEEVGAKLRVANIFENGEIDLEHYKSLFNDKTRMVAITHVSNTLGTINPVKEMIEFAHSYNRCNKISVLVDGAQAVAHQPVDVSDLDCDFYVFSAHKMYGPTGVGILYGKKYILDDMPPYKGGGDMIRKVSFTKTEYAQVPQRFEAGTPNISGVIGLGAAIDFIEAVGMDNIMEHEAGLLQYANKLLSNIKGLRVIGEALNKVGIISFVLNKMHPHDVATILDAEGVEVRAGHHCTMPLMDFYNISATTRISFGVYNTKKEIDSLVSAIDKASNILCKN